MNDNRPRARGAEVEERLRRDVHGRSVAETLDALGVDPERGLAPADVLRQRARHGPNRLDTAREKSLWTILGDQFKSLVIAILAVAAALSAVLGDVVQAAAIAAAIVVNTVIGFVTEWKATRSMEALRRIGTVRTRVRREAESRMVDSDELVPGDVVLFEAGDMVTADVRLIEANGLGCDESTLTGESLPVIKTTAAVATDTALAERTSMAFRGTAVTDGSGAGVVVATGMATELGGIARMASSAGDELTPLEQRLGRLGTRSRHAHPRRRRRGRRARLGRWPGSGGDARNRGCACRCCRARGAAHRRHRRPRPRHVAHGRTQRRGGTSRRGRDPGLGRCDLHRQDRHAHRKPDARGPSRAG